MAGLTLYGFGSGDMEALPSEDREQRKWFNCVSELSTGGMLSIRGSSLLFLPSLLFSCIHHPSLLVWISAGINGVCTGFTTSGSQSMGGGVFLCAGSAERSPWAVQIGCGTYWFVRLRTSNDCSITPFHSLLLYWLLQPRRSAPKEGDTVMAARVPGRVTAILYSRLATGHRSLAIILRIHLHLLSLPSTFATVFL